MKGAWQSLEEQARKRAAEAGVTIISDIDRKPFEDVTKPHAMSCAPILNSVR
jgi:hypothetical protein